MGASASVDAGQHNSSWRRPRAQGGSRRYFCHRCRRPFSGPEDSSDLSCPHCDGTFIEQVEEFSFPVEGNNANRNDMNEMGLTDEQRRRLFNAATLLQLLAAHLRQELVSLENAFHESENAKTPRDLSGLEKHIFLKKAPVDANCICSQPSCPICGEDFTVNEEALQIQCSHFFHENCLVPWLKMKHNCPICRCEVSDKLPSHDQIEELTATEIRQRIAWHGREICSTHSKSDLAKNLYDILMESRQFYIESNPTELIEAQAVSVPNNIPTSLRPGYTYTLSAGGVVTQSIPPLMTLQANSGYSETIIDDNGEIPPAAVGLNHNLEDSGQN